MNGVWTQRVNDVLEDPGKRKMAAILYWLVESSIKSPVTRKRQSPEELLWIEAYQIVGYLDHEKRHEETSELDVDNPLRSM